MSRVFEIADAYVGEAAALDPLLATGVGIPGHDDEMTDYSPDGFAARAALDRRTLDELAGVSVDGERERIARDVMLDGLGSEMELFDAGDHFHSLRTLANPISRVQSIFDQMGRESVEDWANIAARLRLVPEALAGYRQTLEAGLQRGTPAAKRQARECARQAGIWSGRQPGQPSFFSTLLDAFDESAIASDSVRADLAEGARVAAEAYATLAGYLADDYAPKAVARDGVGRDRYSLNAKYSSGCTLDLEETYAWGWEELYRIEREIEETSAKLVAGGGFQEARALLEGDAAHCIEGAEPYRLWLQEVHDEALNALDGVHFAIPEQIKRIEVMIPPPGGALAPYYTTPSEDFSRPGRTWWPPGSTTRFPKWNAVSTAYHEGVPGHHLQLGMALCLGDKLSRFQKLLAGSSGHAEGWALYAERLMGELGYLEEPSYYLGMLAAQALRSVRVIIDIGMHLELAIPKTERFHPGETWSHDLGLAFAIERAQGHPEEMASELVRYLGWPGQAISYKVGERFFLDAREAERQRMGSSFDLKQFHTRALGLGPMGLDQLQRELASDVAG